MHGVIYALFLNSSWESKNVKHLQRTVNLRKRDQHKWNYQNESPATGNDSHCSKRVEDSSNIFSKKKKKKRKQIESLMYLTLLKEMFISERKFRNELRKSMEKSSPTKNNILWIWEKTNKKYVSEGNIILLYHIAQLWVIVIN